MWRLDFYLILIHDNTAMAAFIELPEWSEQISSPTAIYIPRDAKIKHFIVFSENCAFSLKAKLKNFMSILYSNYGSFPTL